MQIARIAGATRVIGKAQNYLGLPLRDEVIACTVNGDQTPSMVSAWEPTPRELAALNAGAAVHVRILGTQHPPLSLEVGEPPSEDETPIAAPTAEEIPTLPAARVPPVAPISLGVTIEQAVSLQNAYRQRHDVMVWIVTTAECDGGEQFAALAHLISAGRLVPLNFHLSGETVVELRTALRPLQLGWMPRQPADDQSIIEWWL